MTALEQVVGALQALPTTAFLVLAGGEVVLDYGDNATPTYLASARKSVLSVLFGGPVTSGVVALDATLDDLGIDVGGGLLPGERRATVRDLLTARSGVYHPAATATGLESSAPPRGSQPPGARFHYNNWDFNALGTIYEHATGERIFTALQDRIAKPVGMQDYQPGDGEYFRGTASEHPAYPIRMSARDLARFVLLYLHEGRWNGRQIVPRAWVRESTQSYSQAFPELESGLGYGYLWWIGFPSNNGAPLVNVPPGTFAAIGAEGQYAFVIPAHDLVIVHRINSDVPVGPGPDQRRPEPTVQQIARLLWLVLSAAGDKDVGPDVSLAHASGDRLAGEEIRARFAGANLSLGEMLSGGPYTWQLRADGTASVRAGAEQRETFGGSWRVDGDRYCRMLNLPNAREVCFSVVARGSRVQFFDADGLMRFDTSLQ